MNKIQKTIKYIAIALGIYLVISIFIMLLSFVNGITNFTELFDKKDENNNSVTHNLNNNTMNLDIDILYSNLKIVNGEEFKLETNNKDLKITENNNTLYIKDKKHLFKNRNYDITIYLPVDANLDNINIDAGAGKLEIDTLKTNNLKLDLGAGLVNINSLIVNNSTDINTGAGSLKIASGRLNNLDLDMGVGEVTINTILSGNNKIDAGVGKLSINLLDSINNYMLDIDKGIGSINLNSEKLSSGIYGNGLNKIKIDGGVGSIKITTVN